MGSRVSRVHDDPRHWEGRFQEAALDPSRWLSVLGELADATGSTRGELIGIGGNTSIFNWISALDDAMVKDFARADAYTPRLNYRVAAGMAAAPLTIVDEADYDRARASLAGDDYIELCERHHFPYGCQTNLMSGHGVLIGLALHRSRRDGRTTAEARTIFGHAAPAALLGVRLQQALEHQGMELLAGTLEAMSAPCLLLDGFGAVRALTAAAERMLSAYPALRTRDSRLGSSIAEQDKMIERALHDLLKEDGPPRAIIGLPTRMRSDFLVLELIRLPRKDWSTPFAPRVLVRLRGEAGAPAPGVELVAGLLSLTRAEAEIAISLCRGQSREEIARSRGVSQETVRGQLKSLYAKTGCNREAQLILLLQPLL